MSNLIEFRITHADKILEGVIPIEDTIKESYRIIQRNYELTAVQHAYDRGLIIMKFEWQRVVENDVVRLIVYRGKVEYD